MPVIQGIEVKAPSSDKAMEGLETKVKYLITSLTDAANLQLTQEYSLNKQIIQLEGTVNGKNTILNGPPPAIKTPSIGQLMNVFNPVFNATFPVPPPVPPATPPNPPKISEES